MLAVSLHCVSGETCVCIFRSPREKFRQVTANFFVTRAMKMSLHCGVKRYKTLRVNCN